MPQPLPRWTGRVHASIHLPHPRGLPRVRGGSASYDFVFEACSAIHSRYGLPDRSTARGGLCHEASENDRLPSRPARQLPSPIDFCSGWTPPPTWSMIVSRHTPTYSCTAFVRSETGSPFSQGRGNKWPALAFRLWALARRESAAVVPEALAMATPGPFPVPAPARTAPGAWLPRKSV